jgi:hypothetical protein
MSDTVSNVAATEGSSQDFTAPERDPNIPDGVLRIEREQLYTIEPTPFPEPYNDELANYSKTPYTVEGDTAHAVSESGFYTDSDGNLKQLPEDAFLGNAMSPEELRYHTLRLKGQQRATEQALAEYKDTIENPIGTEAPIVSLTKEVVEFRDRITEDKDFQQWVDTNKDAISTTEIDPQLHQLLAKRLGVTEQEMRLYVAANDVSIDDQKRFYQQLSGQPVEQVPMTNTSQTPEPEQTQVDQLPAGIIDLDFSDPVKAGEWLVTASPDDLNKLSNDQLKQLVVAQSQALTNTVSESQRQLAEQRVQQDKLMLMNHWGTDEAGYRQRMEQVLRKWHSLPQQQKDYYDSVEGAAALWDIVQQEQNVVQFRKQTRVPQYEKSRPTTMSAPNTGQTYTDLSDEVIESMPPSEKQRRWNDIQMYYLTRKK